MSIYNIDHIYVEDLSQESRTIFKNLTFSTVKLLL